MKITLKTIEKVAVESSILEWYKTHGTNNLETTLLKLNKSCPHDAMSLYLRMMTTTQRKQITKWVGKQVNLKNAPKNIKQKLSKEYARVYSYTVAQNAIMSSQQVKYHSARTEYICKSDVFDIFETENVGALAKTYMQIRTIKRACQILDRKKK